MREVRVWVVHALSFGAAWRLCFETLSADEQARALRMRAGWARDEFVTGRALLRGLLRQETGRETPGIALQQGPQGKPRMDGVGFNVAHAGGLVAIAMCSTGEIGIDVERADAGVAAHEVARAHFAAEEQAVLAKSTDPAWEFVRIWTRKEAVVKALGIGLGMSLDSFDVTANDHVEIDGKVIFLEELALASGWLGCVASVGCASKSRVIHLEEKDLLGVVRADEQPGSRPVVSPERADKA